jgi:acetate kinase
MLVLNAGSSSVKVATFDGQDHPLQAGAVTEIGPKARLRLGAVDQVLDLPDHKSAIAAILAVLDRPIADLGACAHRIVHGGADLRDTCRITPHILVKISDAIPLAPLHNPANLAGIMAVQALAPQLPQYACFDTGFHATNPELATTYALPLAERATGLRRYGFHGISYAGMVAKVQEMAPDQPINRLLGLHLGNGASLCAILYGCSVANTMGYSPLDGLTMGTRAGGLDPAVVLTLARRHGIDGAEALLNRQSGLLALGGSNDMRALSQTPDGKFARDHFAYWAIRHAGSMIAAMGGLDAIAFTGGIGENDAEMRAQIMTGLAFMGLQFDPAANAQNAGTLHTAHIRAYIIPAEEERTIAISARKIFQRGN